MKPLPELLEAWLAAAAQRCAGRPGAERCALKMEDDAPQWAEIAARAARQEARDARQPQPAERGRHPGCAWPTTARNSIRPSSRHARLADELARVAMERLFASAPISARHSRIGKQWARFSNQRPLVKLELRRQ